eukprot:scaffold53290_cov69-Phaeocystis_antarctica.AAC.2
MPSSIARTPDGLTRRSAVASRDRTWKSSRRSRICAHRSSLSAARRLGGSSRRVARASAWSCTCEASVGVSAEAHDNTGSSGGGHRCTTVQYARRECPGTECGEELVDADEDLGSAERFGGGAHDEALDPKRRLAAVDMHEADVVRGAHGVADLLLGAQLAEARLLDDGREDAEARLCVLLEHSRLQEDVRARVLLRLTADARVQLELGAAQQSATGRGRPELRRQRRAPVACEQSEQLLMAPTRLRSRDIADCESGGEERSAPVGVERAQRVKRRGTHVGDLRVDVDSLPRAEQEFLPVHGLACWRFDQTAAEPPLHALAHNLKAGCRHRHTGAPRPNEEAGAEPSDVGVISASLEELRDQRSVERGERALGAGEGAGCKVKAQLDARQAVALVQSVPQFAARVGLDQRRRQRRHLKPNQHGPSAQRSIARDEVVGWGQPKAGGRRAGRHGWEWRAGERHAVVDLGLSVRSAARHAARRPTERVCECGPRRRERVAALCGSYSSIGSEAEGRLLTCHQHEGVVSGGERVLRRKEAHPARVRSRPALRRRLLHELKVERCELGDLLPVTRHLRVAHGTHARTVLFDDAHDLAPPCLALGAQDDLDLEDAKLTISCERRALRLVSKQVRAQPRWIHPVVRADGRRGEEHSELAKLPKRRNVNEPRQARRVVWGGHAGTRESHDRRAGGGGGAKAFGFVDEVRVGGDGGEAGAHQLLELVEWRRAEERERHAPAVVMASVKVEKRGARRRATAPERLRVARGELLPRGRRVGRSLEHLEHSAAVVGPVACVLRVDGLELAVRGRLGERRCDEKLREYIERASEVRLQHLEVVRRGLHRRRRVGAAAMRRQELLVRRLLRVLCRAEEEHVLAEVRETREIGRVVRRTDVDAESGRTVPATQRWPSACALGRGVGGKEDAQAVGERDEPVAAIVVWRHVERVWCSGLQRRGLGWERASGGRRVSGSNAEPADAVTRRMQTDAHELHRSCPVSCLARVCGAVSSQSRPYLCKSHADVIMRMP